MSNRRVLDRAAILERIGPFRREPIAGTTRFVRSLSLNEDDELLRDATDAELSDREVAVRTVHRQLAEPRPSLRAVRRWPETKLHTALVALAKVDTGLELNPSDTSPTSFRESARRRHRAIVGPAIRGAADLAAFGTAAVAGSVLESVTRAADHMLAATDLSRQISRLYDQILPRSPIPSPVFRDEVIQSTLGMTTVHRAVAQAVERTMVPITIPDVVLPDLSAAINDAYRDLLPRLDQRWFNALSGGVTAETVWSVAAHALDATVVEEPSETLDGHGPGTNDSVIPQAGFVVQRLDALIRLAQDERPDRTAEAVQDERYRARVLDHLRHAERGRADDAAMQRKLYILTILLLVETILRGWVIPALGTPPATPPVVAATSSPSYGASDAPSPSGAAARIESAPGAPGSTRLHRPE